MSPVSSAATAGITAALAAIAREPADDAPVRLEALVTALRPRRAGDAAAAAANFDALLACLDADPSLAQALRAHLVHQFTIQRQAETFTELGVLPSTGFFSELRRRVAERLLPTLRDDDTLRGLLAHLLPRRDDYRWIEAIDDGRWLRLLNRLDAATDRIHADGRTFSEILSAARTISHRIASIGLEPDLAAVSEEIRRHESPFVAQNVEMHRFLESHRREDSTPAEREEDRQQILILLEQCRNIIDRIRRGTGTTGISVALTYRLQRLSDNLARLEDLLALLHPSDRDVRDRSALRLVRGFAEAHCRENDLGAHFARNTALLAREITEHSGRTGEHYITATREEYGQMFRAALGAGAIVPVLAFLKIWLHGLHAPPVIEGLLYGLNYVIGFVLIHMLHFTLATKQPAMTATRLAAALSAPEGRKPDPDQLANLVVRLCRSQFIAVVGNIAFAFPLAMLASALWFGIFGTPVADAAKAEKLLTDIHPGASLALWYAAIAGVYLFLSGIVSGYYDNMAVYRRIPQRVARLPWLRSIAGGPGADAVGRYLERNLGGLAGNIFFGFMLGITGAIGFNLGLPLDIRHVTFSSANLAIGWFTLGDNLPTDLLLWAAAGVLLVGMVNLLVSFGLALYLALRARQVPLEYLMGVGRPLLRALMTRPLDFIRPPRDDAGGGTH